MRHEEAQGDGGGFGGQEKITIRIEGPVDKMGSITPLRTGVEDGFTFQV